MNCLCYWRRCFLKTTLSKNQYEAKTILCLVGMKYQKIHSFPYDCILYRNQFAELRKCPTCGVSRYKVKDVDCIGDATTNSRPAKVSWYLTIIPRFKRLFANPNDAKNLTWHADGRKTDGLLRNPANSPQYKTIDSLYPHFGEEPRNLRLGLASDGMNPFGNLSTNHSSWPVLPIIYNLPPWLCIKPKIPLFLPLKPSCIYILGRSGCYREGQWVGRFVLGESWFLDF